MSTAETGPRALDRTGPIAVPVGLTKPGADEVAAIPSPRAGGGRHTARASYATGPMAVSDAALAAAAATSATAFAAIYRRYGEALHGFCLGMLRDPDAAADCVHDVFVTAATRLGQLREHDKLRPWLYAVARHEALRRLKQRRREQPAEELPDAVDLADGPEHDLARRELAALVDAACGGLSDRERAVLELHYRQGLDGPALADALGVSATNANTLVGRLRSTVERSLGALLVARHQGDRCAELAAVLEGWDGRLTVLTRKRVARHIDHCDACTRARRALVDPRALLASAPVAIPAPDWLEGHVLADAAPLISSGTAPAGGVPVVAATWWPAGLGAGTSTITAVVAPVAAAAVAVPLLFLGSLSTATEPADAADVAPAVAAAPGLVGPAPASRRSFAVDPSTTRFAPTRDRSSSQTPPARPDRPRAGGGPAPQVPGVAPVPGAPRRNGIGVPVIPRSGGRDDGPTLVPEKPATPGPVTPTPLPPEDGPPGTRPHPEPSPPVDPPPRNPGPGG